MIDRFGYKIVLGIHIGAVIVAYACAVIGKTLDITWLYFVTGMGYGMSDAIGFTLITSMLMKDVPDQVSGALGGTLFSQDGDLFLSYLLPALVYRVFGPSSTAITLIMQLYLAWWQSIVVVMIAYLSGMIAVYIFRKEPKMETKYKEIQLRNEGGRADSSVSSSVSSTPSTPSGSSEILSPQV